MRVVAYRNLRDYWRRHDASKVALLHWHKVVKAAEWRSMQDVVATFPKAKALNARRARFEIAGGDFRLIAAFNFPAGITFVKFVGTHAEYDRIDALTVSMF